MIRCLHDGLHTSTGTRPDFTLDETRTGASPEFRWSQVHDPNGVSYSLQISQDSAFSSIVLQKTGLTSNIYQISGEDKLKSTSADKPYYWRVMATDGASNESIWSTASTFSVGFVLPSWIPYMFYASSGLLLFGGGFFLGSLFEFDPSQISRLNYLPALKDLFSRVGGFISGLFNFGFFKKILKRS